MIISTISDTHGMHAGVLIPKCDVLVHSGDVLNNGTELPMLRAFDEWAGRLIDQGVCKHVVCSFGNHDLILDPNQTRDFQATYVDPADVLKNVIPLINKETIIEGVKFYGVPQTNFFYNWGFNVPMGYMKPYMDAIPDDTDVLVTHGPPYGGYGGITVEGEDAGSFECTQRLKELKVKLVVCGHIHKGYGRYMLPRKDGGGTVVLNSSICTEKYQPTNAPQVFSL